LLYEVYVYRNAHIPPTETGSITVVAARIDLARMVGASVASGTWLNAITARFPAVVLGATAARRLGVSRPDPATQVWLGGRWFTVVGVLHPVPLASELDSSALIGWPVAQSTLHFDGHPTTMYVRTRNDAVTTVWSVLPATANPENPNEVRVSRPSDALTAKQTVEVTLNGLLLGLGAVALLVGGVGVANTMVISVLERRGEIGLRRALGATRGNIRLQFFTESLLLSVLGGGGGVLLGATVTAGYAAYRNWPPVVPLWAVAGGLLAATAIGSVAGIYPAWRAARLTPATALSTA
jgi:putative ABC transport system permease protein